MQIDRDRQTDRGSWHSEELNNYSVDEPRMWNQETLQKTCCDEFETHSSNKGFRGVVRLETNLHNFRNF